MTKAEQTRLSTWRFKVLQAAGEGSGNVARTCRHFGISRQAFYRWKRRYAEHGEAGLYDRPLGKHGMSRLPVNQKHRPHATRSKRYEKPQPGHRVQMDVKFLERIPGTLEVPCSIQVSYGRTGSFRR